VYSRYRLIIRSCAHAQATQYTTTRTLFFKTHYAHRTPIMPRPYGGGAASNVCVCPSVCPHAPIAQNASLPWGLDFDPDTHLIPTEKPAGIPTESPCPQNPRNPPYPYPTSCVFSLDAYILLFVVYTVCTVLRDVRKLEFNTRIMSTCVFCSPYSVMMMKEKMPVKRNTNWSIFGEIQTATETVTGRLMRFCIRKSQ